MQRNVLIVVVAILMSSCLNLGDRYHIHNDVQPDGKIKRAVTFYTSDSAKMNGLGISEHSGWERTWVPDSRSLVNDTTQTSDTSYVRFVKYFDSSDDSNQELNSANDTLFKVRSEFEKINRFFYSELKYSDTYIATVRFKSVSTADYFTDMDFTFIDKRGGKNLSRADSLYGVELSKRADAYVTDGFLGDLLQATSEAIRKKGMEAKWLDTLKVRRDYLRNLLTEGDFQILEFFRFINDSLKIPVKFNREDSVSFSLVEKRLGNFFDSYTHSIRMPSKISSSNADSVVLDFAFWRPEGKFLYKDYTMYAVSRDLHYTTIFLALLVALAAVVFWIRNRE